MPSEAVQEKNQNWNRLVLEIEKSRAKISANLNPEDIETQKTKQHSQSAFINDQTKDRRDKKEPK